MAGWGCPHNVDGRCRKVAGRPCDPGMKGCVLANRFRFADTAKNVSKRQSPDREGHDKPGHERAEPKQQDDGE